MTGKIMAIQRGRLSLSRITYLCDLQRASGLTIPLGVIAEMTLGPVRVLGLIARTRLLDHETTAIGRLSRSRLEKPFGFLCEEFDWAWENTGAGHALAALAERHSDSLFFAPPVAQDIRKAIPVDLVTVDFAREDLRRRRDEEFALLLAEADNSAETVPTRETALAA